MYTEPASKFFDAVPATNEVKKVYSIINSALDRLVATPLASSKRTIIHDVGQIHAASSAYQYEKHVLTPYHSRVTNYVNFVSYVATAFSIPLAAQHWSGWGSYYSTMVLFYSFCAYILIVACGALLLRFSIMWLKMELPAIQEESKEYISTNIIDPMACYMRSIAKKKDSPMNHNGLKAVFKRELGMVIPHDVTPGIDMFLGAFGNRAFSY